MLNDGTNTYTWKNGRQLATMSKSGVTWSFVYDASGMRTQRTNGSTTYTYTYDDSTLLKMTVGSNTLIFTYGASGHPMSVNFNGIDYYYVTNAFGDVVAIVNASGAEVVTYTYDAWGNILSAGGTMASTLGAHNPFRYRSYVYDQETGLYYLQSRYYNPAICRFISADSISYLGADGTPVSYNLFAYCNNNPVMYSDPIGHMPEWIGDILLGAAIIAGAALVITALTFTGGTASAFLLSAGKAALVGLEISAAGATSGIIRAGRSLAKNISEGNSFSKTISNVGKSFLAGFGDGFLSGAEYYSSTALISISTYPLLGLYNNGAGLIKPTYMIGYQNPNVIGITFYASRTGGRFRLDLDPAHSIHYHYGKTKAKRLLHRGCWIGGLFVGIYAGFYGEVY